MLHNWSPRGDLDDLDHTMNGATLDYDFTYNGVGQMRSRSMSDTSFEWDQPSVGIDNYAVNGLNQYTSIDGASPGYDDNGNMTSNGLGRTYNYDAENVLRSVNGIAGGTATYRYHPDGSRRQKSHAGNNTLHYYMGGLGYLDAEDTAFAADQEIAEANASGQLLKRFIRLPGSIDEAFLMIDVSGGTPVETWAHMNRLGSVVATTNASGTLQDKYRYSPYGMPGSEGAGGFPFRFTGQRMDAETGLYYYKARYYDPQIGRFLQTDPIGYNDQMNLYAYVGNDPVNLLDPWGEKAFAWTVKLVKGGVKKIKELADKKQAVDAAKRGQDILTTTRQRSSQVSAAASRRGRAGRRDQGHVLRDGSGEKGRPHYHVEGQSNHIFWATVASAATSVLAALEVVEQFDPLSTVPKNDGSDDQLQSDHEDQSSMDSSDNESDQSEGSFDAAVKSFRGSNWSMEGGIIRGNRCTGRLDCG